MKNSLMKINYRETLIPGAVSLLLMSGLLALLIMNGYLSAPDIDARIESIAKQSYMFKAYLEGAEIQMHSRDGVVTLTGTVTEKSHLSLAAETVANLPGVRSVDNRLTVRDHAHLGPGSTDSKISGHDLQF